MRIAYFLLEPMIANVQEAERRIRELTQEINKHNRLYYDENTPEISDAQYDALMLELIQLEEAYPYLRKRSSPTRKIGGTVQKDLPVFKHLKPMKSLSNVYSLDEFEDFHKRTLKLSNKYQLDYLVQLKIDGVALSLHYENGELVRGVTRGDGESGEDVTHNVMEIDSIPKKINTDKPPQKLEVRGECVIFKKDFDKINEEKKAKGEKLLANPRNAAAGALKLKDSSKSKERKLFFVAYQVYTEEKLGETDSGLLNVLKDWGFYISPYDKVATSSKQAKEYIEYWEDKRKEVEFETDGLVFKVNDVSLREKLGDTSKSPRWATAYKFAAEEGITKLEGITYQVGRTGFITPVAELSPMLIAGTIVKRASLYNSDEIERLDVRIGDSVVVIKSGEIIPKVLRVLKNNRPDDAQVAKHPDNCPECGTALVKEVDGVGHYCPNRKGCPPQIKGRIEHFASKKALNIKGLGEEVVSTLVEENLISDYSDFYNLKESDISSLDRFGSKSSKNLIEAIEKSKEESFAKTLYALGIKHVGETASKKLVEEFGSLDAIIKATRDEITAIPDIGDSVANALDDFFSDEENIKLIKKLKEAGLTFEEEQNERVLLSSSLEDENFVITGSFENYNRDQLKDMIIENGGKCANSISKNVNYLLAGDNVGKTKTDKAAKLNIPVIDLKTFLDMISKVEREKETPVSSNKEPNPQIILEWNEK